SKGSLPILISKDNIKRLGKHPQDSLHITNKGQQKESISTFLDYKRKRGFNFRMFDRTYFNWYKLFKKNERSLLGNEKFDVILASYGPCASLYIGSYLSKKYKVPWIADFRDLGALYKDKKTNSF